MHPDPSPRTSLPLSGTKVVELAAVLAGPSVGTFLSELGATVLKIENPGTKGDVTRQWKSAAESALSKESAYYASVNWNKKVHFADLAIEEDRKLVLHKIHEADILISSFRPGSDQRLGMAPDQLLPSHPRLVYARINGFGAQDSRVAYDLVLQAETGWMSMNGTPELPGVKMPVAVIDMLAAHQLKEAILLALYQRSHTGKGSLVEVSLYDAALSGLANQASNYLMTNQIPKRMGSLHPNIAPYGEQYLTSDGRLIVLAIGSDVQFETLCALLQVPELAHDPRFSQNTERVRNRKLLQQLFKASFLAKTAQEWMDLFTASQLPAGIVHDLKMVFSKAQAKQMVLEDAGAEGLNKRTRQVAFYMRQNT